MLYDRIADDANREHTANCFDRDLEPARRDNSHRDDFRLGEKTSKQ